MRAIPGRCLGFRLNIKSETLSIQTCLISARILNQSYPQSIHTHTNCDYWISFLAI